MPVEVPVLPDLGPQPTTTTEWRWLAHHDGTGVGAVSLAEPGLVEYVRFDVEGRFRIRALRAQVDVPAAGTLTLRVLDDFGGDGISLSLDRELARASKAVTKADSGTFVTVPLDPPLEVPTGRMFYVATVWESAESPRLRVDAAQTPPPAGFSPSSMLWQSKAIDPATGTPTVFSAASGDDIVELEVQQVDLVAPKDQLFEPMDAETPSVSRAALDDVDGDADLDVMGDAARLWLGRGDGTFEDVSGAALPAGISWNGGAFGDFDGDGDPDWFGTGDVDVLLRNDGGTFVDVTAASGIDDTQEHTCNGVSGPTHVPTEASAWLDYDGDHLGRVQGVDNGPSAWPVNGRVVAHPPPSRPSRPGDSHERPHPARDDRRGRHPHDLLPHLRGLVRARGDRAGRPRRGAEARRGARGDGRLRMQEGARAVAAL